MATIVFRDGTQLTAEQNGTCFILDGKPDFPEDLSVVRIEGEYTSVLHNAVLIECASVDGRYWFSFTEKTAEEIEKELLHESVAALEDALCEQDAAGEAWRAAIEDALCELDREQE